MTATLEEYGLERLTAEQRLALLGAIWDSLPNTSADIPLADWQRDILNDRIAAADANPGRGSSWEDVKARLRGGS
jgi:putative addiction module component (TIGR02574 family)